MTAIGKYPELRYLGEGGEVSAWVRRATDAADLVLGNTNVDYLATGASTDGLFGLYRWEMAGNRAGAEPHIHRSFSESFYVLSGTVKIYDGAHWVDAQPGDYVYVPPGGIHGFTNESGAPASMLILFSPGAPREQYFERLPDLATMSDDERTEFFCQHDNVYLED
jgi:mannose-6-phosphate isomerase-like protein (cupin superfamily)